MHFNHSIIQEGILRTVKSVLTYSDACKMWYGYQTKKGHNEGSKLTWSITDRFTFVQRVNFKRITESWKRMTKFFIRINEIESWRLRIISINVLYFVRIEIWGFLNFSGSKFRMDPEVFKWLPDQNRLNLNDWDKNNFTLDPLLWKG